VRDPLRRIYILDHREKADCFLQRLPPREGSTGSSTLPTCAKPSASQAQPGFSPGHHSSASQGRYTRDTLQQVVEIVCDPARQRSTAFEFLRFLPFIFKRSFFFLVTACAQ
jgi:hypothetical protein